MRARIVPLGPSLLVAALAGCGGSGGDAPAVTYQRDVRPIVEAKCVTCHHEGGIAPFALTSYAGAAKQRRAIRAAVSDRIMPPWLAAKGCADYYGDRSLSDEQIATIVKWADLGGAEGDPADYRPPPATQALGLSRVDLHLPLAASYTPKLSPDEYRCFVLDWSPTTTKFVSGFRANPGTPAIVHHVIAFLIQPEDAAKAVAADDAEPGPGYTCFGDANIPGALPGLLGTWAPGSQGTDFWPGTGLKVRPGSKVVLQVHYNTLTTAPAPDLTSVDMKLDDTVAKEAVSVFWTDYFGWVVGKKMNIPANAPDTMHEFSADPTSFMSYLSNGAIPDNTPVKLYGTGFHMHTRGARGRIDIRHGDGSDECLLEIPRWDFHWQGSYGFMQPKVVKPGDQVHLECHWDNSPDHQPVVNGVPLVPHDLNWGEKTTDEMCLSGFYVTQ